MLLRNESECGTIVANANGNGKIGATDKGGNTRLALSDEDVAGRSLLIEWAKRLIFQSIMMKLVT
jgi:hypothetical protein